MGEKICGNVENGLNGMQFSGSGEGAGVLSGPSSSVRVDLLGKLDMARSLL